jgi:mono/diheme cytochrome c family protein
MKRWLLFLLILVLGISSACGVDLAGDPVIVGTVPAQMFVATEAPVAVNPPAVAPDLAVGAAVYAENCVRCHGEFGAGDGEFVTSGQITEIPDFTDLATTEGKTPVEYYSVVTLGRLDKLMPPFPSLSDEERWSVANYVFSLAGREIAAAPVAPVATEEAAENSTTEETAPESTATTEDTSAAGLLPAGIIRGRVVHGTAGAVIPADLVVTLHKVDATFAEETFEGVINEDGSFTFIDVPIEPEAGYFVSADYGETFFTSRFLNFTGEETALEAEITLYDVTDDPSVIQVVNMITQFDSADDTLQMLQLITVRNTSDRIYMTQNSSGDDVSLRLPAPVGARPTSDNDNNRLRWVGADNAYYDTRPIIPGQSHTLHVIYSLPIDRHVDISQQFDYVFVGPFEVYADSAALRVDGFGWTDLGAQTLGTVTYEGMGKMPATQNNNVFNYTIIRNVPLIALDRETISVILLGTGVALILLAGGLFLYGRNKPATVATEPATAANHTSEVKGQIDQIMQQIAELDDRFQNKKINEKSYRQQRDQLKAQLAKVMKTVK